MAIATAGKRLIDGDLDEEQQKLLLDPTPEYTQKWIETFLTIPNVQGDSIVQFMLFPQQVLMLENQTGRDITVKGRQTRASSLILARNVRRMTTSAGIKCLVMTQDDQTTRTFRARIEHHLKDLARHGMKYSYSSNEDELIIRELENRFMFTSGEQRTAGRAYTAQITHLSEFAHYPEHRARSLLGAIKPAIPGPPAGQCDLESTPNGADGMFYDEIMDSQLYNSMSLWSTHIYPWWIEPRYRVGTSADCDIALTEQKWSEALQKFRPTAEEEKLMELAQLDVGHILWRRITKREQDKTDQPFHQEYPEDIDSCFILASGNYFASPDGHNHLEQYRHTVRPAAELRESLPYKGGNIGFNGPNLNIWQRPQAGEPYVAWVDCAGGGLDERSDFSAISVLNARTMTTVARLNIKAAPDEIAPMAVAICTYYNNALLGGERDAFGATCVSAIQKLQYPNIWYYIDPATQHTIKIKDQVIEPWAHPTQYRNQALTTLRQRVFSGTFNLLDPLMFKQFGSFTWLKVNAKRSNLKAAGQPGQKDDLVICAAGACLLVQEQLARYTAREKKMQSDVLVVRGSMVSLQKAGRGSKPWLK